MANEMSIDGGHYCLKAGQHGEARLRLLDEVYGESTRRLLTKAGLRPGTRILDLACGIGTVACWMAGVVGEAGSVVGVDASPEQLAVARTRWTQCDGLQPVEFLVASAYDTGLPTGSFDLVHCRLLLCHLTEPERAIAEVYRLLKPGGVFVCQDLHISAIFSHPSSWAYEFVVKYGAELGKALGVNYDYGLELPTAVLRAGFQSPEVHIDHPAFLRGERKRLWEYTIAETIPAALKTGVSSEKEITAALAEMSRIALDEEAFIAQAPLVGVIAAKA